MKTNIKYFKIAVCMFFLLTGCISVYSQHTPAKLVLQPSSDSATIHPGEAQVRPSANESVSSSSLNASGTDGRLHTIKRSDAAAPHRNGKLILTAQQDSTLLQQQPQDAVKPNENGRTGN